MPVQAINPTVQNIRISNVSPQFGSIKNSENYYENPIDRNTEKSLAILGTSALSALVGVAAGWITNVVTNAKSWKLPVGIGIAASALTMALTLPGKLYNTKVKAFAREKEMDVFSRQKETQADIYDDLNTEIKDDYVPLGQKIDHYTSIKMAENGNGVMIKGA